MNGLTAQSEFAGKHRAAERGGHSPEKCRGSDKKVSAQRMRFAWNGIGGVQGLVTESDDGVRRSDWSRRVFGGCSPFEFGRSGRALGGGEQQVPHRRFAPVRNDILGLVNPF
jgi:hypothetical protein